MSVFQFVFLVIFGVVELVIAILFQGPRWPYLLTAAVLGYLATREWRRRRT